MNRLNRIRESQGDRLYICLLFLLFAFGIVARAYWMAFHFTHYDDIGYINCLVRDVKEKAGILDYFHYGWTYAPFQVVYTRLLVRPEASYLANIILGRFPSFFCGVLSIFFFYQLIGKAFHESKNRRLLQLIGTFFISTSWENIIYSSQAEPYTIGVIVVIFLTMYLLCFENREKISVSWLILLSVFAFYSQYHSVFFLIALYATLFSMTKGGMADRVRIVIAGMASAFLCLPLLLSFFDRHLLGRGVNWNRGIHGEFVFPYTSFEEFSLLGTLKWFAINTLRFIKYFFVSNQTNVLTMMLTLFFGLVCIVGLYHVHKSRWCLALYIDLIILEFIGMVVMGKLTFSPSRHTLLYYPVALLLFCCGLNLLFSQKGKRFYFSGVLVGMAFLTVYIHSSMIEIPLRRNYALTGEIEKYIEKYKPQYIVAFYGFDPQLMKWPGYQIIGNPWPLLPTGYESTADSDRNIIMLLGIDNPLNAIPDGNIYDLHEQFKDIFGNQFNTREEIIESTVDECVMASDRVIEYCQRYATSPNCVSIYILQRDTK